MGRLRLAPLLPWQDWPVWGRRPHLLPKPCPPADRSTESECHRVQEHGDREAAQASSHFQVPLLVQAGILWASQGSEASQAASHGTEDPGPLGAHPEQALQPLPRTPSQRLCRLCLPALTPSCPRSSGVGVSHPYLQLAHPACLCTCHGSRSHHSQVGPSRAAGSRVALCSLRTSRPRFQGLEGLAGHIGWARSLRTSARAGWGQEGAQPSGSSLA